MRTATKASDQGANEVRGAALRWLVNRTSGEAREVAEDLASEVAVQYLSEIQGGAKISNPEGWAITVAKRTLWRHREATKKSRVAEEAAGRREVRSDGEEAIESAQGREAVEVLAVCLEELANRDQAIVLRATYLEEATASEIASDLGMSPENVRQLRWSGTQKLLAKHRAMGHGDSLLGVEIGLAAAVFLERERQADLAAAAAPKIAGASDGIVGWLKDSIVRVWPWGGPEAAAGSAGVALTGAESDLHGSCVRDGDRWRGRGGLRRET